MAFLSRMHVTTTLTQPVAFDASQVLTCRGPASDCARPTARGRGLPPAAEVRRTLTPITTEDVFRVGSLINGVFFRESFIYDALCSVYVLNQPDVSSCDNAEYVAFSNMKYI